MCSVPVIVVGVLGELLFGAVGEEGFESVVIVASEFSVLVFGGHVVVTVLGVFLCKSLHFRGGRSCEMVN